MLMQQDRVAESILDRLADLGNHPEEHLAPYEEFTLGAKVSNFTPGGSSTASTRVRTRSRASFVATSPTRSGSTGPPTDGGSFVDIPGPLG